MRTLSLMVLVGGVLLAFDAQAQRIGYGRYPQSNDYTRWDQPVQGTTQTAATPETPEKVTYLDLTVGELQKGHLALAETHYLKFTIAAPTRCLVELASPTTDLQLAFLDDITRVVALGDAADLKAGTYFLRLKTRTALDYQLTLRCSSP